APGRRHGASPATAAACGGGTPGFAPQWIDFLCTPARPSRHSSASTARAETSLAAPGAGSARARRGPAAVRAGQRIRRATALVCRALAPRARASMGACPSDAGDHGSSRALRLEQSVQLPDEPAGLAVLGDGVAVTQSRDADEIGRIHVRVQNEMHALLELLLC